MYGIEGILKPILKEMGLYEGKEVSVKEAFEKYLKAYPKGIGPLWKFKTIASKVLNINVEETDHGENYNMVFTCSSYELERQEYLEYDPRVTDHP